MNTKIVWLAATATALLGACTDFTGGNEFICQTQAPARTGMRGDTVTTQIGLMYIDSVAGTGATLQACQAATIDYNLYLRDGTKFDSSSKGPINFIAGAGTLQIMGVDVGVIGMQVGGVRRLIVPPELAFGDRERRDSTGTRVLVPANSTIVADVTLRSVGAVQGQ